MVKNVNLARELVAMSRMAAKALRAKYAELFGEACRTGNRRWLLRRYAWRLQSLAEGGLSKRAAQRAKALARDADLRVVPPGELNRPAGTWVEWSQPRLRRVAPPDGRRPSRALLQDRPE
jgi:hypothetical protein